MAVLLLFTFFPGTGELFAQDKQLSVEIIPAIRMRATSYVYLGTGPKISFYILLKNNTDRPLQLFDRSNSWGAGAITFSIRLPQGTTTFVYKLQDFTRNVPSSHVLAPADSDIIPVFFQSEWRAKTAFEAVSDGTRMEMQAFYEVVPSQASTRFDVWTGQISSRVVTFEDRDLPPEK